MTKVKTLFVNSRKPVFVPFAKCEYALQKQEDIAFGKMMGSFYSGLTSKIEEARIIAALY